MQNNEFKNNQNTPVLEVRNISKSFGHVQALDNVSMKIYKGDIVGLFGDNGAGKSTLIKIISGIFPPNSGKIFFEGKEVNFDSTAKARAAGIETVHQNSPICENISVYENFFLGREIVNALNIVKSKEMYEETLNALKDTAIKIPSLKIEMGMLSGGQRQAVILSRFFYWKGKVALLDEPFVALGVTEYSKSIELIRTIGSKGLPIILVTHDIEQAFQIVNKFYVLRHGKLVGEGKIRDVERSDIIGMITGAIAVKN